MSEHGKKLGTARGSVMGEALGEGRDPIIISVASLYGAATRKGLVALQVGGCGVQMDPAKAREVAGMLLEAASAAESDEVVVAFLVDRLGMDIAEGAAALAHLREIRQERFVAWKGEGL